MWTHINMMFYSDFIYNINLYDDKPVRLLNTTYSVNLEAEIVSSYQGFKSTNYIKFCQQLNCVFIGILILPLLIHNLYTSFFMKL